MMKRRPKPMIVKYEDLVARVIRHKAGEYRYKSPRMGYRRAWKYDRMAYIYFVGDIEHGKGYIEVAYFKLTNKREIAEYMAYFKTSLKYKRAVAKREGV